MWLLMMAQRTSNLTTLSPQSSLNTRLKVIEKFLKLRK